MTKTFDAAKLETLKNLMFGMTDYNRRKAERFFDNTIPAIQAGYAAGEITKIANKELRDDINRFVEIIFEETIAVTYYQAGRYANLPVALQDVDYLREARLIGSYEKKLDKAAKGLEDHPMVRAARNVIEALRPLQEAVEFFKSVEYSTVKRREEVKEQKEKEQRIAQDTDVVYQTVLPLKLMAQDRAEAMLRDKISRAANKLRAAGGNIDAVAPAGEYGKHSKEERVQMDAKRAFYFSFVKRVGEWTYGENDKYELDAERVETLVRQIRNAAGVNFDKYVAKLNEKINDITLSAKLQGDPWSGSLLTVETQNKGTQVWHTQVIINFSKYGTMFNQWPTRLKA